MVPGRRRARRRRPRPSEVPGPGWCARRCRHGRRRPGRGPRRARRSHRPGPRRGTRRRRDAAWTVGAGVVGAPRTRRRARLASCRAARGGAFHDRRDLGERHPEHVVQHERQPFRRLERLQDDEQRQAHRVGEQALPSGSGCSPLRPAARAASAGQVLAAGLPRAEQVDADPADHGREPAAEVLDSSSRRRGCYAPTPPAPRPRPRRPTPASGRPLRAVACGAPRTVRRTTPCHPCRPALARWAGCRRSSGQPSCVAVLALPAAVQQPGWGWEDLEHPTLDVVGGAVEHPRKV